MTLFFANHEITIYRMRKKTGVDKFTMSATFTVYNADIQPASQERQEMAGGRFGATFQAFVDTGVDIKENDQVRTEDGKVYSVRGVSKWDGSGILYDVDHVELILVSQDA